MSTLAPSSPSAHGPLGWLARVERWLDERGKPAWIIAMIAGFIFVWPVGLAILAYMIWSKRMFSCSKRTQRGNFTAPMTPSSGNRAFDAYRDATLARLQEEQDSFVAFLDRLRQAKDKAEFDQFMNDRSRPAARDENDTNDEAPRKEA